MRSDFYLYKFADNYSDSKVCVELVALATEQLPAIKSTVTKADFNLDRHSWSYLQIRRPRTSITLSNGMNIEITLCQTTSESPLYHDIDSAIHSIFNNVDNKLFQVFKRLSNRDTTRKALRKNMEQLLEHCRRRYLPLSILDDMILFTNSKIQDPAAIKLVANAILDKYRGRK